VNSGGIYTVTVTDGNGCSGSDNKSIVVNALPNPTITPSGNILTATCSSICTTYQWKKNGNITCANTSTCNISGDGSYTVTVTDDKGCIGTSSPFVVTGISNYNLRLIRIHPNPSSGKFILSFSSRIQDASLKVLNSLGEMVYKEDISYRTNEKEINLNVPDGIYLFVFQDLSYRTIEKVIIQH
jgi:hypothetical protein